jgi:acyl-CoA synthetase (AMP-forming)/AMP-acid ligase II
MLDDYVRYHAELHANDIAVIRPLGEVPFWKFEADIRRTVYALGDLKVEPNESVSLSVEAPYIEWLLCMALSRLGIASAPGRDAYSKYQVTDDPTESRSNTLLLSPAQLRDLITGPDRPLVRNRPDPDTMGRLFCTSGTTNEPKRIGVSWRALANILLDTVAWQRGYNGPWMVTTGIQTPFGYNLALGAHMCGYPAVIGFGPKMDEVLQIRPRVLGLVPVHIQMLLDRMPEDYPRWPLTLVTGGSAVPPEMATEIRRRLTTDMWIGYGATETMGAATADFDLMLQEPLGVGRILPGVEVRILDDHEQEVQPGGLGRICVSSNKLAMGYPGDPEGTARHFRDGWFHSTDLGRLRNGLLYIEGRVDELMNLGGHKTLPGPIDAAVTACPGVKEAAAFAFKDKSGLDRCGIAVVADEGYDEEVVRNAAATKMTKAQRSEVLLIDRIPRNVMGKVERLKLREMMEQRAKATTVASG